MTDNHREMQLFLFGFLVISICEIFTIGGFPLNSAVKRAFTAIHIAAVVSTAWILLLNAVVGFQLLEDGTPLSMGLVFGSSIVLFIGSGYIALDTGFSWTHYWDSTLVAPNRAYALYTIYLLLPLVFIAIFFVLEGVLVVGVLGERRPLSKLTLISPTFPSLTNPSLPRRCSSSLRPRPDLPIRRFSAYLQRNAQQDKRRPFRDAIHITGSGHDLGLLVKHY